MKHKIAQIVLLITLLLNFALVSCVQSQTIAPFPPRPDLQSTYENELGGICLDRNDTEKLLLYLDTLERR